MFCIGRLKNGYQFWHKVLTVHPWTLHRHRSTACSQARNAQARLKSCSVIFVRRKRICHLVRTCLTFCCSLTCRSPRADLLPHSLFFLPRHQNTLYNRDNTVTSKNNQYTINLSKKSRSKSGAIKNSGVKTCRVAETRAKHSPQKVDDQRKGLNIAWIRTILIEREPSLEPGSAGAHEDSRPLALLVRSVLQRKGEEWSPQVRRRKERIKRSSTPRNWLRIFQGE